MREIEIEGKKFQIRGLKRSEIRENNLWILGYRRNMFQPPETENGKLDVDKLEEGQDKVLEVVLGQARIDELDEIGGNGAMITAWNAIVGETYGVKAEEKN